jgi:hypothetical protein
VSGTVVPLVRFVTVPVTVPWTSPVEGVDVVSGGVVTDGVLVVVPGTVTEGTVVLGTDVVRPDVSVDRSVLMLVVVDSRSPCALAGRSARSTAAATAETAIRAR